MSGVTPKTKANMQVPGDDVAQADRTIHAQSHRAAWQTLASIWESVFGERAPFSSQGSQTAESHNHDGNGLGEAIGRQLFAVDYAVPEYAGAATVTEYDYPSMAADPSEGGTPRQADGNKAGTSYAPLAMIRFRARKGAYGVKVNLHYSFNKSSDDLTIRTELYDVSGGVPGTRVAYSERTESASVNAGVWTDLPNASETADNDAGNPFSPARANLPLNPNGSTPTQADILTADADYILYVSAKFVGGSADASDLVRLWGLQGYEVTS